MTLLANHGCLTAPWHSSIWNNWGNYKSLDECLALVDWNKASELAKSDLRREPNFGRKSIELLRSLVKEHDDSFPQPWSWMAS
jgi:hypothetical protein